MTPTFTGTLAMARLVLRRDRVRMAVWLAVLIGLPLLTVSSLDALYPAQADLDLYAATAGSSPAATAMNGPGHGLGTLGGVAVFEMGGYLAVAVALMNVFTVGRHTRAEEEIGRVELIRANPVGRHAALAGCLLVVLAVNVALGAAVAAGMGLYGLSWAGSVTFGGSLTAIGVTFAAVTALAAQVVEFARGTYAIAGATVALAYLVRAAGDVGDPTLSWFSPIGWAQATRPFAQERWWPLLLCIAATVVLGAAAFAVQARRDLGAGVVRQRPGPRSASATLLTRVGLAVRLQRGGMIGWAVGVFVFGLAFGSVARETEDMMAGNPQLREILDPSGRMDLTDVFFQATLLMIALAVAGYAVSSALRVRAEETAGRAEALLAGALSRQRWSLTQLAVPVVMSIVLLAAGGLGAGLAHAVLTDDPGQVPRIVGAAVALTPAVWVLAGLAVLLFGFAPRATGVVWAVLGGSAVASLLGTALQLPGWAMNVSPFEHVPELPGGDVTLAPLAIMTAVAAALLIAGVAGFRRRDLATA